MTPFDPYEQLDYVSRGPRTPRDMSSFNWSKGIIGHPMTPFDLYERFQYVFRCPRTPRDIFRRLIGRRGS